MRRPSYRTRRTRFQKLFCKSIMDGATEAARTREAWQYADGTELFGCHDGGRAEAASIASAAAHCHSILATSGDRAAYFRGNGWEPTARRFVETAHRVAVAAGQPPPRFIVERWILVPAQWP